MTSAQERKIRQTGCDVRFDNLTRQLYSTDASIYQIHPVGAAFPKTAEQASLVIHATADAGLSITPRGAGTSLVGNAIGDGLIVDFSRHNRQITDLDLEKRSVRVGAGVVLDQLNDFLKPHGFCFGPDVATSSRATLGGMIANNSSGARCPIYGTTADHVNSLEIVLADGRVVAVGEADSFPQSRATSLDAERQQILKLVRAASTEMAERWPPGLIKRWPGYGIERFLRLPNDLTNILAGSEGTLAAIFSAELKISPLPREKGLGLIFFASVAEAMQATVELLDLKPAAIEHIDRPLFDGTKGQLQFQAARDLLELESKPCESILIVEFYDDSRNDGLGSRRNMTAGKPSLLGSSVDGAIVDLAIEKNRLAHKDSHRPGANEHGLVRAQIRSVAFDGMHRTGEAGRVHRRRCCSSRAIARLRARFAINHETAGADGELLRPCRQWTFARATGARYAQRRRSEKIPASRR